MSLKLNPLENNCAIEVYHIILKDLYNENYNALYVEIANIVNNIPLGLQVTAAYLRQSMLSTGQYFDLQEYVDEIKQDQDEYIDLPIPTNMPNKYEKSLYGAIQTSTSINRFKKETNGLALNALFICAFLNPEDITITDLLKMPNIKKLLTQKKNKENTLRKALSVIVNYSFITYNPNGIEINLHRFIQEVLRRHLLKCDKDIQLVCYSSCLEAIFNDTQGSLLEYISFRHNIILKYSDENIDSFNSFHQENKNKLNLDDDLLYSILKGLINWNCIESLKKLLDDIKLCTYKHISHFDLLHIAAMSNNVNVMELLVSEYDIQINSCRSDALDTPLHTAAFLWNLDAMNFLLERNADVNVKDCMNETPLVKFLLSAQYHQHFELDDVNKILNLLNCRENQHCPNECVKNLLHAAVHSFNANLVTLLATKYKFDVNARDDTYGDTPLHELISSVSSYSPRNYVIRTIKALKSRGARLDITDSQGRTPWQIAQEREDTEYLVPYLVLDYESTSEYEPVSKKLRDD